MLRTTYQERYQRTRPTAGPLPSSVLQALDRMNARLDAELTHASFVAQVHASFVELNKSLDVTRIGIIL